MTLERITCRHVALSGTSLSGKSTDGVGAGGQSFRMEVAISLMWCMCHLHTLCKCTFMHNEIVGPSKERGLPHLQTGRQNQVCFQQGMINPFPVISHIIIYTYPFLSFLRLQMGATTSIPEQTNYAYSL